MSAAAGSARALETARAQAQVQALETALAEATAATAAEGARAQALDRALEAALARQRAAESAAASGLAEARQVSLVNCLLMTS